MSNENGYKLGDMTITEKKISVGKLIPIVRTNLNYCNLDEIDELTELAIVLEWQEEVNNKEK